MRADYGYDELNTVIEELRPKLPEYLQIHGVLPEDWDGDMSHKFLCINPEHDDKNPSMSLIPKAGGEVAWCFTCAKRVDIFTAATWLEGLPNEGKEWITQNVYALAREFEIDFVEHEPTPEELKKAKVLEMLSDAADCLVGTCLKHPDKGFEYTRSRGLKDEICREMGVGTVDWMLFADTMRRYGGWDVDFMEEHGVSDYVFGNDFVTITLRDHRGMVVGFDRRFIRWDKEAEANYRKLGKAGEYPKKWYLPRSSDVFDPRTFLYGLHIAKRKSYRGLDIVEGYFDALSGMQAGHETIVACCGTSGIKEEQVAMLVDLDFEEITIVFDSDEAGKKACNRYLKDFGGRREFRLKFKFIEWDENINVPDKDKDPDTFFRMFCKDSLDAYEEVPTLSSFRVALNQEIDKGTAGENLARLQIPHIVGEPDPLHRGKMIRELADRTGVSELDIRMAVDHVLSGKARNIVRDLTRDLERLDRNVSPTDINSVIKKAESKLSPLFGGSTLSVTARAAKANYFEALDFFDNDRGAISGYRTLQPALDENLGGIQKGMFWVVAGNPNSGKSALVHDVLGGAVLSHQENKDMIILFFSFDDTTQWSWAKQLARYTGLPIKWMARPRVYIYHDPELTKKYRQAQAFFREHVGDTLRIFGGDIGMNIDQIKRAIKDATDSTGKHPVVVVDSFNKMQSVDGVEGFEKFARNADELHALMHDGMTVICTAETVKAAQGRKPKMTDLSDTKKLAYDANVVSIVYNPLHELREKAGYFHVVFDDERGKYKKSAVIQLDVVKNRLTDFKGHVMYQFNDNVGTFNQIDNIKDYMNKHMSMWARYGKDDFLDEDTAKSGGGHVHSSVFDVPAAVTYGGDEDD